MGRIPKWRRVAFILEITYFKPVGVSLRALDRVRLSVEEAEAIRLKDLGGLEQEECAQRMSVSRPTFHRVLGSEGLGKAPRESIDETVQLYLNGRLPSLMERLH